MTVTDLHILHDVDAAVYFGNDVVACRTFEIGRSSCGVTAPCARAPGSLVRLQCHLDDAHWLDADAVLIDCRRSGADWHWHLAFPRVPHVSALDRFLAERRARTTTPPPSIPAPLPSSMRPPSK